MSNVRPDTRILLVPKKLPAIVYFERLRMTEQIWRNMKTIYYNALHLTQNSDNSKLY